MLQELNNIVSAATSALLIIDMQNDYCHPDGSFAQAGADVSGAAKIVPAIDRLRGVARASGVPVIHVRTEHSSATDTPAWDRRGGSGLGSVANHGIVRRGTWGAAWFGVTPGPDEQVVVKHRYSAFVGTDLESRLRMAGVDTLVVAGVTADICVESTVRDACMRDFFAIVPGDAVASHRDEHRVESLRTISRAFGVVGSVASVAGAWMRNRSPQLPADAGHGHSHRSEGASAAPSPALCVPVRGSDRT